MWGVTKVEDALRVGGVEGWYGVVDSLDVDPLSSVALLSVGLVGADALVAHLLRVLVQEHELRQRFRSHSK